MRCTLVFAQPADEWWVPLELPDGATVGEALAQARAQGAAAAPAGLDWDGPVGIFGQACTRATALQEGDRIELYRPLRNDPKEARRRRATGPASRASRARR